MGGDGLDERLFATLEEVQRHDGNQWWLYASTCSCGQSWMIAQDERIHDNFYLKRISEGALRRIREDGDWPDDFLTYEQVLRLGAESGKTCRFLDAMSLSLIWTVEDLRRERRDISADEIAYLLAVSTMHAKRLLTRTRLRAINPWRRETL
jgi:hypothetical protein